MGWVDKPHKCNPPTVAHGIRVGQWWECDYCKLTWGVQARVRGNYDGQYKLTYVRRDGNFVHTISWMEFE